jgi:hypothetical protein
MFCIGILMVVTFSADQDNIEDEILGLRAGTIFLILGAVGLLAGGTNTVYQYLLYRIDQLESRSEPRS